MEAYKQMKIAYIAETSLTNKSAYTHHVLKMCDAFSKKGKLILIIPELKNYPGLAKIRTNFLLNSKRKFKIIQILGFKSSNFIYRLFFSLKTAYKLKNYDADLIITRSILSSLFLSLFKTYHYLEIHNELRGLTRFLMINLNNINSNYIRKIIFISNSLKKKFRKIKQKKILILHDAVNINNFPKKKNKLNIKNLTYMGSFHQGKGVELIIELAKKFQHLNFHLYGAPLKKKYEFTNNLKIYGHINYNKVPRKLLDSDILLLPSSKVQFGRSKSVNISNYNSPLKMFDYLAAGRIIVSSKRNGISEILKHNYNSIIVKGFSLKAWEKTIYNIIKNKYNLKSLRKKSLETAKKFTWDKRVDEIINSNLTFKK